MEIKMCTCPNGHYYNADIYSSCPECGAVAGGAAPGVFGAAPIGATEPVNGAPNFGGYGGAQDIGKTAPVGGGFGGYGGAQEIGKTAPVGGGFGGYGGAQEIGKTAPAGGGFGGNVTVPVTPGQSSGYGSFGPTVIGTPGVVSAPSVGEPVVGWLVCVDGPVRGVDFRLHDGYNFIGREEGDIHIHGDNAISRQKHAVVAFYAKRNSFHVGPADGRNIIELNGEPVFNHTEMKSFDVITVGNTKLMLVALCGDNFSWTEGAKNG